MDQHQPGRRHAPEFTGAAFLNIDTGPGSSTVRLGAGDTGGSIGTGQIIAKEGSVITGEDVSLFVDTIADLRAATLENISSVVLDDDSVHFQRQPAGQ